jgi:7-cyano-7-deazaguanine synthase
VSKPTAIVLLSGGLDSTTCLAIAQSEGFEVIALSFRYGQRHTNELECAAVIANAASVEHLIVDIDLAAFGGSALVDDSIEIPKHESVDELTADSVPVTYVPARNTIFLSFATAVAETRGAHDVFIGVNAVDYSGYPDCRPEYVRSFEVMANLATKAGVESLDPENSFRIHAPIIQMSKAEIIRLGAEMGINYSQTVSCYQANTNGEACGICESCQLRKTGFSQAGISDPTRYQINI